MRKMWEKWKGDITSVVITAIITFVAMSPFTSFQTKHSIPQQDCSSPDNQIALLEQYGEISLTSYGHKYYKEELWSASFETPYRSAIKLSISVRGKSMCEAIDNLYYKVMEYPLPKVE